jgi:hypothetical protein
MALFRPRKREIVQSTARAEPVIKFVIQNENYQRRQRNRQSLRLLVRFNRVASVIINRADHSAAKLVGVGAACQSWIPTVEQSGLQTRIATMGSVLLCVPMKY